MTEEDSRKGWWDAPARIDWRCPDCGVSSPVVDWTVQEVYCEDCGDHDGRRCPWCGSVFDHVWGAEKIAKATKGGVE